jgi:DedD protein
VPEKPASVPQVQPIPVAEKPMEKPAAKKSEPKPESKPEAKVEAKPAANTDAFVVQLGAFSDPAKARQRQQSLTSNGIKAFTEILKTDKGEMTRVRAGPFATRDAAEKTREKLKKLGLDGVVTNK